MEEGEMRRPRLIASDIDGTLLFDGHGVTDETIALVERLLDAGIEFVPTSGRQYANLRRLFAPIAERLSYVAEGGALAVVRGEVVYEQAFLPDVAQRVVEAASECRACEVMASGVEVSYVLSGKDAFAAHLRDSVGFDVAEVDNLAKIEEPCLKVAAFFRDGMDLREVARWRQLLDGDCLVVASAPQWVDFVPLGLNKAKALQVVLDHLGIDPADVIAFGDGPNDCEVFELVGCPVAVAHADPNIVRRARYVTDMVESSLASILDSPGYNW